MALSRLFEYLLSLQLMAVSEGAAAFHQSSLSLAALMSKKFCSVDKRDKRFCFASAALQRSQWHLQFEIRVSDKRWRSRTVDSASRSFFR